MAQMIYLHFFDGRTRKISECLVNLDTVTYCTREERTFPARPALNDRDAMPELKCWLTVMSFAAGMNEETESILVTEDLDTIYFGRSK